MSGRGLGSDEARRDDRSLLPGPVMRDRVPMWLAVAITVAVSLPFGLWLGDYALPLWVGLHRLGRVLRAGCPPGGRCASILPAFVVGVLGALAHHDGQRHPGAMAPVDVWLVA